MARSNAHLRKCGPKLHDAVLRDDEANLPERTLVTVVQTGYRYHERVLRPARVVVSSGKGYRPPSVEANGDASRQDASAESEGAGSGQGFHQMARPSGSTAGRAVQDEPVQQR